MARFHETITADSAYEHVKKLASYGPRHAATENEKKAIDYIRNTFASYGNLEVNLEQTNPIVSWAEKEARLRVISPIEREITCHAILGCGSTPPEGITAELVYGKRGFPEHYEGLDLAGKIIIHDPPHARTLDNRCGEGMPQRDITRVKEAGVKGLIEYARIPGKYSQAPLLAGREGLQLPALSTTYDDGLFLKELLLQWYAVPDGILAEEKIPVKVWIKTDVEMELKHSYNVVATKTGSQLPNEKVILLAHHDNAFGPGAVDNAASVAVILEVAKALSKMEAPKRTIEFVTVSGEEYGQAGSSDYVKKHISEMKNVKACIVMDLVGGGDQYYYITKSLYEGKVIENSPQINNILEKTAAELGLNIRPTILEYASDDAPFIVSGVPTSYICRCISKSWPWLHTWLDTPDVVDPNALKVTSEICINTLLKIANE